MHHRSVCFTVITYNLFEERPVQSIRPRICECFTFTSAEEVSELEEAWQTAERWRRKHICFSVFLLTFLFLLRPHGGNACDWYFVNAKAHRMNP